MADPADNAGGGAPTDNTTILRRLIERDAQGAAVGPIWDPIAVRLCFDAGLGAQFPLRFGGKIGPTSGQPIDATVTVTALKRDAWQSFGPTQVPLGDCAAIKVGGVEVVLITNRTQALGLELFRNLDIEPTQRKLVVVKSTNHFMAAFGPIAEKVIYVDSDGPLSRDYRKHPLHQGAAPDLAAGRTYLPRPDRLTIMDDNALMSLAADLALEAGAAILAVREHGFDVQHKHDASPVTEADRASEAIIVRRLRQVTPDIPVIAEEEIAAGHVVGASPQFWLVDPLDGTREFAAGKDEFVVNIGLIRNGRVALGIVAVPALGELFGGVVGHGAWKRTPAGEHPIHARTPPSDGLVVVASRLHGDANELDKFLHGRRVAKRINYGSALKFCRLAEGEADFYPRFGRTMEWDTAAPQAVVEAAGGAVCTLDGTPLLYGKPGWENPHFVCTGRPAD